MPKILFNPTNETLAATYIGEETSLEPGAKVRVDDARANAILSNLYPRGLCELEFGDEGDGELRKAEAGRERNREFKKRHVLKFNAQNDQQIQTKRPYIIPDPVTKAYARELGMKLFEPYTNTDDFTKEYAELKGQLDSAKAEISEKDKALQQMQTDMAEMRKMMSRIVAAGPQPAPEERDADIAELRKTIKGMNKNQFATWVQRNFETILAYPESIQGEIRDKYEKMYGVSFPKDALEAKAVAA